MAKESNPCLAPVGALATRRSTLFLVCLATALALVAGGAFASKVRAFRAAEAADFLVGTLDGVSVGPLGKVRLARALEKVASVEEPFVLSATSDGQGGFILGTGNSGKVLRVTADGTVSELFATKEPEVFAVWLDGDVVYAAGSPDARLYRYVLGGGDEATMILDTGERYVWGIAREKRGEKKDGRILLATGTRGKLLALDEATGKAETVYDSEDPHLRSLLVRDSDVVLGTAGEGRILSLTRNSKTDGKAWRARTLYDAAQPEITSLTAGPEGSFFAAAVASEASPVQLAPKAEKDADDDASVPAATGSRPNGFKGARSVVLEFRADGSVETRGSFDKETVYSLLFLPVPSSSVVAGAPALDSMTGTLWVATGQDGKLYRSQGQEMVLESDLDELQLVQLFAEAQDGEGGLSIATTNGAAVYRTSREDQEKGEYSSKALDTKFTSKFGTLHYQADLPAGAEIEFLARSGQSAFPDDTWSEWVTLEERGSAGDRGRRTAKKAGSGFPDLDLSAVPRGRYFQWRVVLSKGRISGPELSVVEVSYRQENRRPEITELKVLAPGVVLVKGSFNPSNQVFEPTSPNRDGIFNSLDKPAEDSKGRAKELWKLGYRTMQWKATDPNDDPLLYELSVRREGTETWYTIAEEISKTTWGFDATVMPDGFYRVRLRVHDGKANTKEERREAERTSGLVVIDHSAPTVEWERAKKATATGLATVTVVDALSALRKIEISRDAALWQELIPVDGMVDSRRETVTFERGDASLVLLRVSDVAFNTTTLQVP